MKIHITNLYNFNQGDELVKKQHRYMDAARTLGFREMGIFSYPVETDTAGELSKRLDGVIASLEPEDVVFMQLPTRNGYHYEYLLAKKIKGYKNTKLVLILHDADMFPESARQEVQSQYQALYRLADSVIVSSQVGIQMLQQLNIPNVLMNEEIFASDGAGMQGVAGCMALIEKGFYTQKILMDATELIYMPQKTYIKNSLQKKTDEVHICFGLHDRTGTYSSWVGITMQSVIEHTNAAVCFHILHDETLSEQNRNKLIQVASQNGNRVSFHFVNKDLFKDKEAQMKSYTVGALFRIMIPEVLNELSQVIYLDADLFVNRDIKELWDMDISNYCLAAVPDEDVVSGMVKPVPIKRKEVAPERYFNSGVIYMNLTRIRQKGNMRIAVMEYLEGTKESDLPDQDALNFVYRDETLLLDGVWNYFVKIARRRGERKLENKIYHYVGTFCLLYYQLEADRLYYETTSRTPWGAEESTKQLNHSLYRMGERLDLLEKVICRIADTKRKRIFYGPETFSMRNLYQMLHLREGDYRILSEPGVESDIVLPCRDFNVLVEEKEPYVVFVLPEADGGKGQGRLKELGLKEGTDYFIIPKLFLPHRGGYV